MNFFSFNFPLHEYFFCTSPAFPPPPPDKVSNGPSLNTVEPPESDHPKCNNLVIAYMRWSLNKRVELHEVFQLLEARAHLLFDCIVYNS